MKVKNLGKKLCVFTIILAFIVSTLFVVIINIKNGGKSESDAIEIGDKNVIKAEDIYYNSSNYWAKDIVSEIVDENVPIPDGYIYDKGNKETGIVVKKKDEDKYLLWIPYDENVTTENVKEYYSNCDYITMDSDSRDSIEHYGGFYINISDKEQYENLKNITNEQYETGMKNSIKTNNEDTTEDHLISKEELAQVKAYKEKIGKDTEIITGVISTNINPYLKLGGNNKQEDELEENKIIRFEDGTEITIPAGFNWFIGERKIDKVNTIAGTKKFVLKIKDLDNPNLIYIWVPVKDNVKELKQKVSDMYSNVKVEGEPMYMYNWEAEDPVETKEYKELVKSINRYNGFYMAEGELGEITEDGKTYLSNKARGMKKQDDNKLGIYNGEYFRGNNSRTDTINEIKKVANVYKNGEKTSVKSHLTYGIEWDAVMLWILETKLSVVNEEQICKNSSSVSGAKYNSNLNNEIKDEFVKGINGIYGLAGNLVDITQEVKKYDATSSTEIRELDTEYIIGRGGSYADSGDAIQGGYPIASRMTLTKGEIIAQNTGFRNCLYIALDETESSGSKDNNYNKMVKEAKNNKWSGKIAKGFARGKGTESNPYIIETPEQLAYLAQRVNDTDGKGADSFKGKYIKITNSMSLDNREWTPIGNIIEMKIDKDGAEVPGKYYYFEGTLDGAGHGIADLNVQADNGSGLIGVLKNGNVKNLTILSGEVGGNRNYKYAGAIAACTGKECTIENCQNYADVTSIERAGGITGQEILDDTTLTVKGCNNYGNINVNKDGGGIVGLSGAIHQERVKTIIENCRNYGEIVTEERAGGIAGGLQQETTVSGCINEGKVTATKKIAGGIVGYGSDKLKIKDCSNNGEISTKENAGGIIGYAQDETTIDNCTNEGEVTATTNFVGGIIGYSGDTIKITNCKNSGDVETQEGAGGICGYLGFGGVKNDVTVEGCSNSGKIKSKYRAGGIIGYGTNVLKVYNCKNQGDIEASEITGGIVGAGYCCLDGTKSIEIQNCSNKGNVTGDKYAEDICGWKDEYVVIK